MSALYGIEVKKIDGTSTTLKEYEGKVLLIVNVASQCGFTPQYEELQALYLKHKDAGFAVLGFPCNQFGEQEPGSEAEIKDFCELNFGVSFPMFAKIEVNGADEHPLYTELKREAPGLLGTQAIKWNFTKFLIDRSGKVVDRFAPTTKPSSLDSRISELLK